MRPALAFIVSCAALATAAHAETVIYDCEPYQGADICRSHWEFDGDAKTASWCGYGDM